MRMREFVRELYRTVCHGYIHILRLSAAIPRTDADGAADRFAPLYYVFTITISSTAM